MDIQEIAIQILRIIIKAVEEHNKFKHEFYKPICTVCNEPLGGDTVICFCSHEFHSDCLSNHIERNGAICPTCSKKIGNFNNNSSYEHNNKKKFKRKH